MSIPRATALHVAYDPMFLQHRSRGYHPERPERLAATRRAVDAIEHEGASLSFLPARDARDEEILAVHAVRYVDHLRGLAGQESSLDADTYVAPASVAAAWRAAGASVALVEALLAPDGPHQGIALVRPPGHHATRDQGMGFCLLNNVAIASAAALRAGVDRLAIIDWDVHHGNGTQDIFWSDGRVLFISLHEAPLYPGTGAAHEVGGGAGLGRIVNVPLPPSADDAVYRLAFEEVVLPTLLRFGPELVLISAGFDAHARDPLASMQVTEDGYAWMGRAVRGVADETAGGRVGVVLEGGYDLGALEVSLAASLRGVLGWPVPSPGGEVGDKYRAAIEAAKLANLEAEARRRAESVVASEAHDHA
jgi:acetoin utilization deacetylase AcuC-like enzyme